MFNLCPRDFQNVLKPFLSLPSSLSKLDNSNHPASRPETGENKYGKDFISLRINSLLTKVFPVLAFLTFLAILELNFRKSIIPE